MKGCNVISSQIQCLESAHTPQNTFGNSRDSSAAQVQMAALAFGARHGQHPATAGKRALSARSHDILLRDGTSLLGCVA